MVGITIKDEQYQYIRKLIEIAEIKKKYSYRSPTDFIIRAIADKISEIEKELGLG